MNKSLIFVLIFVIIILGVLGYWFEARKNSLSQKEMQSREQLKTQPEISMEKDPLEDKKIAMIVAFRDFRDEEYFIPRQIFEQAGGRVVTVSSLSGRAVGVQGGEAEVDLLLDDLKVDDFDAIVFVGGTGAAKYFEDERAHKIAREALEKDKLLAAICIAPAILAKAGVLEGKKATVWSGPMDKTSVKILKENGAEYLKGPVVVDGRLITANGPAAAKEFAEKIIEGLTP